MGEARWERQGALCGVVFVVLAVVVAVVGGDVPSAQDPALEISGWFASHVTALQAGVWLFGLATLALVWWFGSLWHRMVRLEGGSARLAVVSLMGLMLAGALSLSSSAVWAATSLHLEAVGEDAPLFLTLGAVLLAGSGFGVGTHLLATNLLAARTRALPAWLVAGGFLAAVVFLVASVLVVTSHDDPANLVQVAGFGLWLAWILGVSHRLWADARTRTVARAV